MANVSSVNLGDPRLCEDDISLMPLGQILLKLNYVQQRDLEKALIIQQQVGGRLGEVLMRAGSVSETNLLDALSLQLGFKLIGRDLDAPSDENIFSAVDELDLNIDWLVQHEAIVWRSEFGFFCLARDPLSSLLDEALSRKSPDPIQYCLSRAQVLDLMLNSLNRVKKN